MLAYNGYMLISGAQTKEPTEMGIMIREIQNKSNEPVIFINAFELSSYSIAKESTLNITSWIPSANVEDYNGKKSISSPGSRCGFLVTKSGTFMISFGRYFGKADGKPMPITWIIYNELSEHGSYQLSRPIAGYSFGYIEADDNGHRTLVIDEQGSPEMLLTIDPSRIKHQNEVILSSSDFELYFSYLTDTEKIKLQTILGIPSAEIDKKLIKPSLINKTKYTI